MCTKCESEPEPNHRPPTATRALRNGTAGRRRLFWPEDDGPHPPVRSPARPTPRGSPGGASGPVRVHGRAVADAGGWRTAHPCRRASPACTPASQVRAVRRDGPPVPVARGNRLACRAACGGPTARLFRPRGTRRRHAAKDGARRGYWPTMHVTSPQTASKHSASACAFRPAGGRRRTPGQLICWILSPHRTLGAEPGVGGPRKDAPLPAGKCRCKACPALHEHRLRSSRRRCFFVPRLQAPHAPRRGHRPARGRFQCPGITRSARSRGRVVVR